MKRVKVKMRKKRKKATMMRNMKMKQREKEKREPRISSKAPKSAQGHNGVQQHPLLESQNRYEAGENLLRCTRGMQSQGLLNHTPSHRSR
jgi:hypothetical protein